jgi:hypothetical protein
MAYIGNSPALDETVSSSQIVDLTVATADIAADAITGAKIADDAIDSEHYTDASIDEGHIADNAVTLAKMAGLARGKIIYGDASGDPAALALGTDNHVLTVNGSDINWEAASSFNADAAQVFNESGADADFRVEGSGEANALFVQGSDGFVGIGTASPLSPLHVVGGDSDSIMRIENSGAGQAGIAFKVNTSDRVAIWEDTDLENGLCIGSVGAAPLMFINTQSNKVGIGTTTPASPLHVDMDCDDTWLCNFEGEGNDTGATYCIRTQHGFDDASGTNYVLWVHDGDGTNQGGITFTSGTVTYSAFTANHDAELPESDSDGYTYGTLVEHTEVFYKQKEGVNTERGILYKVRKSSTAYAKNVLGCYAGKHTEKAMGVDNNLHQINVLGDGHIICNGEKGNISVGDGICSSSTDGEGMKADKMAMIIGIAQEDVSFSGGESKLVAVQYGLQQFTPWVD